MSGATLTAGDRGGADPAPDCRSRCASTWPAATSSRCSGCAQSAELRHYVEERYRQGIALELLDRAIDVAGARERKAP